MTGVIIPEGESSSSVISMTSNMQPESTDRIYFIMKYFRHENDSPKETAQKDTIIPSCLTVLVLFLVSIPHLITASPSIFLVSTILSIVSSFCTLVYVWKTKKISTALVTCLLIIFLISIFIIDLVAASNVSERLWPLIIVIIDILLCCRISTSPFVLCTVLYLLVTAFESNQRVGIFDIESYPGQKCIQCTCGDPPCPKTLSLAISDQLSVMTVFLLDYFFTSNFAKGLICEKLKVEKNVLLAEKVIECLVKFDLERAESEINSSPMTELTRSLTQLVRNLELYRPFLPESLFEESEVCLQKVIPPPGLHGEQVSIVFTDIKNSTDCWESAPLAMKKALRSHNNAIRNCMRDFNGYEIKTIGDSFMVAFTSLEDAFHFGLQVHCRLLEVNWPTDLLHIPHCKADKSGDWSGLRVRIGISWGDISMEVQQNSDRFDYFGPIVNQASRIERVCIPGAVCASEAAYKELRKIDLSNCGVSPFHMAETIEMSNVDLRGIGKQTLWCLVPSTLPTRCEQITYQLLNGIQKEKKSSIKTESENTSTGSNLSRTISAKKVVQVRELFSQVLQKRNISVASIDIKLGTAFQDYIEDSDPQYILTKNLKSIISSADRTDGIVISVLATSVTVAWNVSNKTVNHVSGSFRFSFLLSKSQTSGCFIGLSNGGVFYGTVGALEQRFVTAVGSVVNVASALCYTAADLNATCLYSSTDKKLSANSDSSLSSSLRPVDTWCLHGKELDGFIVYQVSKSMLSVIFSSPDVSVVHDICVGWEWSDVYEEAFIAGDVEIITKKGNHDRIIRRVIANMNSESHFREPVKV